MKKNVKNLFRVEDGISFIVTTQSNNINKLREVSERYKITLPDARVIIIYSNGALQFYNELDGYAIKEFAFSCEVPEDFRSRYEIGIYALGILASNIENLYCGKILEQYLDLGENGIDYEEC